MTPADPTNSSDAARLAQLQAILDNAVDAIITISERGIVQTVNAATERLFGYTSDEIVGNNVNQLMPSPYHEEHDGYLSNYLRTGERKIIGQGREVVGKRKDGSTFPMHLAVSEINVGDSRMFTGIVRDISDLKERQARLEAILDNAVDAIITIDEKGIVQGVNPATARLFGYVDAEIIGNNVKLLMPSPYHEEHDGYLQNYRDTGVRKIIGSGREVIGKRKDGSTFPMHLAVSEIIVGDRRMFTGIVRDISDLKERQARLQAILDNAVDAIITIDEKGIVQGVNPATAKLFNYDDDEIIGNNVKLLMPSPYHEEHDGYLQNYRDTGVRKIIGSGREVIGKRKDGSTFPMHLAVSEIKLGDRRMFTGIVRDITDLKEAESGLKRLNEELEQRVQERTRELHATQAELVKKEKLATLGQVSGGIAHEIRNPLNAVKSSAYYLLNAKNPSPEKTREHLERVDRQVTIIDNVVTALSDVARLPDPKRKPTDIGELLKSVVKSVSLPHTIEVVWELPDDLPHVLIDANQIPIVFKNLVRNARDAMPEGGKLTVSADADDSSVSVFVADTGIGIPPEDLTRITEPLYSTKARGMGLGLAISRAIVDKNGGEMKVESQVGEGTRFTIILQSAGLNSKESNDV